MTRRWPLHPHPGQGEALSSWLTRVALAYGMDVRDLLGYNLGPTSVDLVGYDDAGGIDLDPPASLLAALSERTGVADGQLRQMTVAGWVPWLLDTLEYSDDSAAFTTYVRQGSVLLAPGEAVEREVVGWRPWLLTKPMHRACPVCMSGPDKSFTLMSQIPLMLSCPHHGCRLEPTFGALGSFYGWATEAWGKEATQPSEANEQIVSMDRRTHESLTTGRVRLPRRSVHVGVWLRLLRTLLDEVSTPASHLRPSTRRMLKDIWRITGQPCRGGQTRWRPYEEMVWSQQQAMLEAAATALGLTRLATSPPGARSVPCYSSSRISHSSPTHQTQNRLTVGERHWPSLAWRSRRPSVIGRPRVGSSTSSLFPTRRGDHVWTVPAD